MRGHSDRPSNRADEATHGPMAWVGILQAVGIKYSRRNSMRLPLDYLFCFLFS